MIAGERRALIITKIESNGLVDINELALELKVSEITIRRDLVALEKEGLLRRVHGGAVNSRGRSYEPPLSLRSEQNRKAKQMIAQRAAELIDEGDCVAIDVGSTTSEVARHLVNRHNLTIITPSLSIACLLANQIGIRLILPGGIVRQGEASMIGEIAQKTFESFYVDKLILGVGGIDINAGLTEYNWDDAMVKKAMIKSAKRILVVADASKFNTVAFASVAKLSEIHQLITDQPPPENLMMSLHNLGVEIEIVHGR